MKREVVVLAAFVLAFVGATGYFTWQKRNAPETVVQAWPQPVPQVTVPNDSVLAVEPLPPETDPSKLFHDVPTAKASPAPPAKKSLAPKKAVLPPKPPLDEKDIANLVIAQNTSWLFEHDAQGKLVLTPQGKRLLTPAGKIYANYVALADQQGIQGTINQHTWAVAKMLDEAKQQTADRERAAALRKAAVRYADVNRDKLVQDTADMGQYVRLSDGSIWQVAEPHRITTAQWGTGDPVMVVEGTDLVHPYILIRKGNSATARLLVGK